MGIDQLIGTVSLTLRQAGLRFGPRQVCLRLFQRGAIGTVINGEQHLALLHFLAVGVIHLINVAGHARAQLNALHRFNPAVKAIPLANRFHHHVSGTHGRRRWRGILRDAVIASDEQHGEQHGPQRAQMRITPGFLQAHYFYSDNCRHRARRSRRHRATSFVRELS